MREHVKFIYLVDGGTRLRAHDGALYNYHNGEGWPLFDGVPPQGMLKRIRDFGKQVECLLMSIPEQKEFPTKNELLAQLNALYATFHGNPNGHMEAFLSTMLRKSHYAGAPKG